MSYLKNAVHHLLGKKGNFVKEIYYAARFTMYYRGKCHICPCCSSHLNSFIPMVTTSGKQTPDVICPRCDSHPRHRLLWHYFQHEKRELFEQTLEVLHMAPEFSLMRLLSRMPNINYTSADLDSPVADCHADICCLPFRTDAFDLILCNHVLEHVPDDCKAMKELFRVLKPGGTAVLQVPIGQGLATTLEDAEVATPEMRERLFGQHDHVRLYGDDYSQRLTRAGFSVEIVDYVDQLDKGATKRYGLDRDEKLYLCGKIVNKAIEAQNIT